MPVAVGVERAGAVGQRNLQPRQPAHVQRRVAAQELGEPLQGVMVDLRRPGVRTDPEPVGLVGEAQQLLDLDGDALARAALGQLGGAGGALRAIGGVSAVSALLDEQALADPRRGARRQPGLEQFVLDAKRGLDGFV